MELYVGGYAQGKLEYVLENHEGQELVVIEGADMDFCGGTDFLDCCGRRIVINNLHLWVRNMLNEGKEAKQAVEGFVSKYEDCIIISDEIGNGIVPLAEVERNYRECLGHIHISLAEKAERVERVICGIGQRLK